MLDSAKAYLSRAWARQQLVGDPVSLLRAINMEPDPWQTRVLKTTAPRVILSCSRQSGKSQITATKAITLAESKPGALVLIGAPSQNQSAELLRKAMTVYNVAGATVETDQTSILRTTLKNKARLICVPGNSATVRAYSAVDLIIVDEAAYCEDEFYEAVMPMIAVSKGRIMLLSTPHAKQGAFYEIWEHAPVYDINLPDEYQPDAWLKIRVTWEDCPRISKGFIEEYRKLRGDLAFRREFMCEFQESLDSVFTREEVDGMVQGDIALWDIFS